MKTPYEILREQGIKLLPRGILEFERATGLMPEHFKRRVEFYHRNPKLHLPAFGALWVPAHESHAAWAPYSLKVRAQNRLVDKAQWFVENRKEANPGAWGQFLHDLWEYKLEHQAEPGTVAQAPMPKVACCAGALALSGTQYCGRPEGHAGSHENDRYVWRTGGTVYGKHPPRPPADAVPGGPRTPPVPPPPITYCGDRSGLPWVGQVCTLRKGHEGFKHENERYAWGRGVVYLKGTNVAIDPRQAPVVPEACGDRNLTHGQICTKRKGHEDRHGNDAYGTIWPKVFNATKIEVTCGGVPVSDYREATYAEPPLAPDMKKPPIYSQPQAPSVERWEVRRLSNLKGPPVAVVTSEEAAKALQGLYPDGIEYHKVHTRQGFAQLMERMAAVRDNLDAHEYAMRQIWASQAPVVTIPIPSFWKFHL